MVTQACQSMKMCCLLTVSPGCGYTSMSEHEEDVLFVDCVTGLWLHKYVRA